jgi:4-hydroxybenzoate polyprenyltransferase
MNTAKDRSVARGFGANMAGASFHDLLRLARPKHWTKSSFVLAPLVFSEQLADPRSLQAAALAFACFCLWSSAVYCVNDVIDARADASHPTKRYRPIPSGHVSPAAALALAALLAAAGVAIGLFALTPAFVAVGLGYLLNSVVYCLRLKYKVIIDVISIASGFVLRIIAGCVALGVAPSSWILVCGFSLAMLLAFGKRRMGLGTLSQPRDFRGTLASYSIDKVNLMLGISASLCLLSFMLYATAPETIRLHGTGGLVYTVPLVAYGVFRYLFKMQEAKYDGPVEVLFRDPVFALNGALWGGLVVAILYFT